MSQILQPLPLGIQDFKRLRQNAMLYVDKTEYVYHLSKSVHVGILLRPRRFGKSLLCSTLRYLFEAERSLFKDLWIDHNTAQIGFKWVANPVIHLDMSLGNIETLALYLANLSDQLKEWYLYHNLPVPSETDPTLLFSKLIFSLYRKTGKGVVILIDEYDAPVVKQITRPEAELQAFKNLLRNFYGILKGRDAYLRFLLLTGISKFTRLSVFSTLNNLQDISLQSDYARLLGYSQAELESYFKPYIQNSAAQEQKTESELLNQIKLWYNGYRFAEDVAEKVYNPYSTLSFFQMGKFKNYWFESGSTKLLMDLIRKHDYDVRNLNLVQCDEDLFMGFEPETTTVESLFYYTGYLTLTQVRKVYEAYEYDLGFPNHEVKWSFYLYFIKYALPQKAQYQRVQLVKGLRKALETASVAALKTVLHNYFSLLLYPIQPETKKPLELKEHYYQSLLYALFYLANFRVPAEDYTNVGRTDLVCELPGLLYLFELKLDQSAAVALAQIKTRKYYEKYQILDSDRTIYMGGLNFNTQKRNLDGVILEQLK